MDEIPTKIKHKVKFMVKFVNTTPHPPTYIPSLEQLST